MSEIVVVGDFTARQGKEDDALEAFKEIVQPTHDEDGCILYALHRGADDPRRLAFIERWESREKLDAHIGSEHVKAVLARQDELFEAGEITVYEAVQAGEPQKGSIAEHAAG